MNEDEEILTALAEMGVAEAFDHACARGYLALVGCATVEAYWS
jgi:serine protease inhibitor